MIPWYVPVLVFAAPALLIVAAIAIYLMPEPGDVYLEALERTWER